MDKNNMKIIKKAFEFPSGDRDINAAMNILIDGNKILVGGRTTELTLVENPTVDDRCENNLKSGGSLK